MDPQFLAVVDIEAHDTACHILLVFAMQATWLSKTVHHALCYSSRRTQSKTLGASTNHTPNADEGNEDEGMPEVMSTPQQPTATMRFDTLEDAEKHYKLYARQKGFGVRYNYRKKSEASGEIIRASLVCHKAGLKIKKKEDTQNPQPVAPERWRNTIERTDCPAHMLLKRRDNSWVVTESNDDHNHPLIKKWSLTGFLRSHRHIPEEE